MASGILVTTGHEMMARLDRLATYTETPGQGLTRVFLTPQLRAAGEQLITWMQAAGMQAGFDAIGNVVGRYPGEDDTAPALMLGSHYDTVRNAGKYDGPYGIVAAIAVVESLKAEGRRLPFPIEVVAFGDEEGVRFKSTLIGSRALAGTLDAAVLETRDADGVSLRAALRTFGGDAEAAMRLGRTRGSARAYLEAHIEQGPVLERDGVPVAIVTSIAGATRFVITLTGETGHAGTVPMRLRRDAAAAAAEFVLAVEARCSADPALVGTVGMLATPGGAANVIPGVVELSLDVRAETDGARRSALADLQQRLVDITARRGVRADLRQTHDANAVACDACLRSALSAAASAAGIASRALPSGAGHDAMAMVDLCPVGMLFVRCGNGGISHDPREIMTAEDAEAGARVLLGAVEHLAATD